MWGLSSALCTVYLPQTHQVLYVCGVAWPCGLKKSKENCFPSLLSSENELEGWGLNRDQEETLGILWEGTPICNLWYPGFSWPLYTLILPKWRNNSIWRINTGWVAVYSSQTDLLAFPEEQTFSVSSWSCRAAAPCGEAPPGLTGLIWLAKKDPESQG